MTPRQAEETVPSVRVTRATSLFSHLVGKGARICTPLAVATLIRRVGLPQTIRAGRTHSGEQL